MNMEKQYGSLLILGEIPRPLGKNYGKTWVHCKCECGNEVDVALEKIKYGQVKSCGCARMKRGPEHKDWRGCGEISMDFYSTYKRNAKGGGKANRREKEFAVSIQYLWELFLKQNRKCALTGLELSFDCNGGLNKKKKQTCKVTASIDRIDSRKGYVEGNVQWIHKHINIMKNDLPQDVFVNYCKLVARNSA